MGIAYTTYKLKEAGFDTYPVDILVSPLKCTKCAIVDLESNGTKTVIRFSDGTTVEQTVSDGTFIDIDRVQYQITEDEPVQLAFDAKLLAKALTAMKSEGTVIMTVKDALKGVTIDGEGCRMFVLPVRYYGHGDDDIRKRAANRLIDHR